MKALDEKPHADADTVFGTVKSDLPGTSLQAVYGVLAALTGAGLLRRIEPAGSLRALRAPHRRQPPPHRLHQCGAIRTSTAWSARRRASPRPTTHGFAVQTAEVTFWGLCPDCQRRAVAPDSLPRLTTLNPAAPPTRRTAMTNPYTTTQTGTPVASDEHSLTAGADGATALHDRYLVEKLAQFNRERVPERNVHAKGGGAFGEFEVTEDVSQYTRAAVFQPGAKSETLLRFSSVAGELGSPDTWRDVRGFALRFYTTEGNLDIVGNNTPVFFIRDAHQVPGLHPLAEAPAAAPACATPTCSGTSGPSRRSPRTR